MFYPTTHKFLELQSSKNFESIVVTGTKGKTEPITYFPNSKRKVNGILIPQWNEVLETAVKATNAAGFTYMGADLFIHPEKGPMIVELGFPGLSIQLCNRSGLKRRIEPVENLDVRDARHGVKIAQALFAEYFADKIKVEESLKIISTQPSLTVLGEDRKWHQTDAHVNTGCYHSAISENFADQLGLVDIDDLLWQQQEGIEGKVPVVEVTYTLKGVKVKTAMVATKKLNKKSYKVELGRKDLPDFLIGEIEE